MNSWQIFGLVWVAMAMFTIVMDARANGSITVGTIIVDIVIAPLGVIAFGGIPLKALGLGCWKVVTFTVWRRKP